MSEQICGSVGEWLAYAKHDLDSANFLLSMKPMPIEIICFHCQQVVQKQLWTLFEQYYKRNVLKFQFLEILKNFMEEKCIKS